jgi:hypothetical protein
VLERTGLDPDEVVVLAPGSLPRTSSGKLRRQEALRRHLEGELDARRLARLASEPARVGEGR